MALGKAFIEVHADLSPFKKDLGKGIATMLKETQKAVGKAVNDGLDEAASKSSGKASKFRAPKIKPEIDTSGVDKDADMIQRKFGGAFRKSVSEFTGQITEVLGSGATYNLLTAGLITAGIIASPFLAGVIASAITLGIGLAGIGGGIALAFQDARIKSAASEMGDRVMAGLSNAGAVFLGPVKRALEILESAFGRFLPKLERGFAAIAPYVDNLALGVAGFLDALGPGLEDALAGSGPLVQVLADYLPVVGDALGYMFQTFAENAGARAALAGFFQLLTDAVIITTDAMSVLASAFGAFITWLNLLPPAIVPDSWEADIQEMADAMWTVPEPAAATSASIFKIGDAASGASSKAKDLTASLDTFFGAQLAWVDANVNFEGSIDKVAESFKGANDSINAGSAKGREHITVVNDAIKAAIRQRDAKIKETGSVAAGNAVYATSIERLRGVLKNAGLTKGEIEKLIGAYDDIPPGVSTEVSVPGLATALTQAQMLNYELNQIQHDKLSRGRSNGDGHAGGYAEGGVVRQEQLAWVGEGNRPEAIIPLSNPGRAAEVMAEAGLLGMGGGTIIVQMVLDGKVIDERIVRANQSTARQLGQQPRALI